MSELITLHPEYAEWIKNIGVNFKQCQIKAASRVNEEMLWFKLLDCCKMQIIRKWLIKLFERI